MPSCDELKAEWERVQGTLPDALMVRMRRAISWLCRAEREREQDHNAEFIFYWIAFNAAYAKEVSRDPASTEREQFAGYFRTILPLDSRNAIFDAIWETFHGPIRLLLENQFVYRPFWEHHAGRGYDNWEYTFEQSKQEVYEALGRRTRRNTHFILSTLFDRLYVLRIQLMHGGATWRSSVNRAQVQDGARIMATLVPVFVGLMMSHPNVDWGPMDYPVVHNDPGPPA